MPLYVHVYNPVSNIYADNAIHKLKLACLHVYVASFPGSHSRKGEESLITFGGGGGANH